MSREKREPATQEAGSPAQTELISSSPQQFQEEPPSAASEQRLSRKERKKLFSKLHHQLTAQEDDTDDGYVRRESLAYPLGLPADVVEFHLLQYCEHKDLLVLAQTCLAIGQMLFGSDTVWEMLWRNMNLASTHQWKTAKKKKREIARPETKPTYRKKVEYVLLGPSNERGQRTPPPQSRTPTPPPMASTLDPAKTFAPTDAMKYAHRLSNFVVHVSPPSLTKLQVSCKHEAASTGTFGGRSCIYCDHCKLAIPIDESGSFCLKRRCKLCGTA